MGKLLLQKNRFMPGALKKSHLESGLNQQDRAKSAASLHSFLHKKCRLDDGHFSFPVLLSTGLSVLNLQPKKRKSHGSTQPQRGGRTPLRAHAMFSGRAPRPASGGHNCHGR